MKMTKRILSLALALVMMLSYIPAAAFAADSAPALPTASVKEISNDELTFAMNFKVNPITEEQLAYYGNWYADFELTINKDVTFNADGSADGWLSGQYDEWSENWVNVPFGKFAPATIKANEPLRIMAFAAELMGEPGLKYTYKEVYEAVRDFDCGVFFDDEFLLANPDLEVKLELKMYNPANEAESYVIGETYTYENPIVAKNTTTNKAYATATEALLDCADGQTVVMLKDSVESVVYVFENMTLDLNGHTLVANYMSSFGNIIDSSASNTGLLKVSPKRIVLQEKNKQLPVRDGDGYRFVEVLKINTAYWSDDKTFVFDVRFEPGMLELLKNGQESTGVTIQVRASWQEGDGRRTQNFVYKDEVVHGFLESYKPSTGGYGSMFFLELDSTEGFEDLTFAAVAVSTTGVGVSSDDPIEEEPGNVTTDANGQVVNDVTIGNGNASAVVPSGTQLENGVNNVTLNATTMEKTTSNITLGDGEQMVSMNVHVDGVAANNTKPIIVTLNELAPEFLNQGNLALYHVENGETMEMTRVYALSEVDAHNEYYYDIATGTVTMALATFSEVAVVSEQPVWEGNYDYSWYTGKVAKRDSSATIYEIYNADQLAAFGAIVGGMAEGFAQDSFAGKTVKLMADIDLNDVEGDNKIFYPIGYWNNTLSYDKVSGGSVSSGFYTFEGTFDGNGNTIANFYQNTWEMFGDYNDGYSGTPNHYRDGMGLFGKVYGGTIKNLTVSNFTSDGEYTTTGVIAAYADCGANFENISITECNPRVYNIGNGGIVGCVGWYAKEANTKVTFKNITVDNTNKITALWGSWDVACGGILGQYYPTSGQTGNPKNAGVSFENCHVAAQIDVYNDVCANYQYYAYRYAGMLIGSVRENVTVDGHEYPKMDGITFSGCTVHFGDWNDYYYCELVANSLASYTHDHQMSRLEQVAAVDVNNKTITTLDGKTINIPSEGRVNYVVVKAKNEDGTWIHGDGSAFATCYHFVNGVQHFHDVADNDNPEIYETVNDEKVLKEDKQLVYREFNNLVTGYGWGVTSKGLTDFNGVEVLDSVHEESVSKFVPVMQNGTVVENGTYTLSQLFGEAENAGVDIVPEKIQVFLSPADENSKASGTYEADATDWTMGELTLNGTGAVTITITDYYYCTATTITLYVNVSPVAMIEGTKYATVQDALNAAQDGDTIILQENAAVSNYLDIYTPNKGETERAITLDLNGYTISWGENYKYEWYPLVFVGINQKLIIKDGSIVADEHIALGVYGEVELDNVTIESKKLANDEQTVCIWNWSEDDDYYQDCQYLLTGSATISGGNITGGILAEGPVTLNADAGFDKLYLNTKTGYGKVITPEGYGLVKKDGCYQNLHQHSFNEQGACTICKLAYSFQETAWNKIQSTDVVVITMKTANGVYALTSANGASDGPTAVLIEVDGDKLISDITDALKWNIGYTENGLIIYPNGTDKSWLYCIDDNDGVRVGTNADNVFIIDEATGYLMHVTSETEKVNRYIGIYNSQDWRCYKTINDNIKNQTLAFYVLKTNCTHENTETRDAIAATCTKAGHAEGTYCLDCDSYIDGGELINVLGHKWSEYTVVKEATCTKDGKEAAYCSVCNKVTTRTIKVAHTEVVDAAVAATCTTTGLTEGKHCSVCNEVLVAQTVVDMISHTWSNANCTAAKTCSVCGTTEGAAAGHTWVDATCTTPKTCSVCGDTEGEALGHTEVVDEAVAPTCKDTGLTEGSHCSVCNTVIKAQQEIPMIAHNYEGGKCSTCGAADPNATPSNPTWQLVTDASSLKAGDQIIIVAKDYNYALSTNQKTSNRGAATVEKNDKTVTFGTDVQIITLEEGTTTGTFAFYVEGSSKGYLYAASSSSNNLKTQSNNDANGSWKITIAADGTATIKAQGSYTRNVMQYNPNNGSPLFACYSSASQQAIVIYKLTGGESSGETPEQPACQHTNTTTTTTATCTEAGTKTVICDDCEEVVSTENVAALGHTYENGECTDCGEADPNASQPEEPKETTVSMSIIADQGQGVTASSVHWTSANGDVTFENTKGNSTSSISVTYNTSSTEYRIYKSSNVAISADGQIKTIVVTCSSNDYAKAMAASLKTAGYTATYSGSTVTISLNSGATAKTQIDFTATAQIRVKAITVTYTA